MNNKQLIYKNIMNADYFAEPVTPPFRKPYR